MKKIIFLLSMVILTSAIIPGKDLIFQIGKGSNNLLVNGDNFSGSSFMFWSMWKGQCRFICTDERVVFVEGITFTGDKKLVYGSALLLRVKSENRWKCIFFIGNESVAGMGGIAKVVYIADILDKVVITYGNNSTTTHEL